METTQPDRPTYKTTVKIAVYKAAQDDSYENYFDRHVALYFTYEDGPKPTTVHIVGEKGAMKFEPRMDYDPAASNTGKLVKAWKLTELLQPSNAAKLVEVVREAKPGNFEEASSCQEWVFAALQRLELSNLLTTEDVDRGNEQMTEVILNEERADSPRAERESSS